MLGLKGMNGNTEQLVFLGLFAATWLIGGNILIVFHHRRLGKPWWSGFRPFAFPFKNFNGSEWLALMALGALSLVSSESPSHSMPITSTAGHPNCVHFHRVVRHMVASFTSPTRRSSGTR
jgi:hypothetical protein